MCIRDRALAVLLNPDKLLSKLWLWAEDKISKPAFFKESKTDVGLLKVGYPS